MTDGPDCTPMVLHPYRFQGHPGWQGTGHCGVFRDGSRYFLFHQGRLSPSAPNDNSAHLMVLHMREIVWLRNGWPVVSPERYAGVPQKRVRRSDVTGTWEHMVLAYQDKHNVSGPIRLTDDGEIRANGAKLGVCRFGERAQMLELRWGNGFTDRVRVIGGLDWERRPRRPTLLYTGLNGDGTAIWGKKVD